MWIQTKSKKYGVAIYNWRGDATLRYALPLEIGDAVHILEEHGGWFRGYNATKSRQQRGIFPQSYVHLRRCKVDQEGLFESVVPVEDAVVREVTLVLREWGDIWKRLYVARDAYKFETVGKVMRDLLEWRRQLVSGTLTHDQTRELKIKIISKIDWGNRKLGLDLVPRQEAQMVDQDTMSVVELFHVHVTSADSFQGTTGIGTGTIKRKEQKKILTHHLFFCMRDFGHHVGEDSEIYLSLYDNKKRLYISERFLVKISKEGFSNYVEKLHNNCTIFTDLGNNDLNKDIFMVAHVMRVGKMHYSESSKKPDKYSSSSVVPQIFKRPLGVAVHNLGDILVFKEGDTDEKECNLKVYQCEDNNYHQLHDWLINRSGGKFTPLTCQPNYGIMASCKLLHGQLAQLREETPLAFKNVSLTQKLGFPDVIMPGDVRNDLHVTLERGEFEKGGKPTGKNIEVAVLVLDSEKNVIKNCLWGASGMDGYSEYNSMIIYHHNSPSWFENIRLTLPIDQFAGAHIRLEYRHCSTREKNDKKLFGFSFVRLMDKDGAAVQDGQHELFIYKCEDAHKLDNCGYLSLPAYAKDYEGNHEASGSFSRSQKELVYVRTLLCSTKLTQNVDLLSLLRWKEHPERIQESLQKVLKLGNEELVKFLQDVLDALFALFSTEDGNSTTHSGLVFHVLVSIFNILDGSKFQYFKPVLDAYIKDHFAAALVYKGLLTSVQHCADWVMSFEKQEPIEKCFLSLEYIFKLIIQSRLLFSRATCGQYEDSFRRDLYIAFESLNKMLSLAAQNIVVTQVALLTSISAVYEQLVFVLPPNQVTKLAISMLDSLPKELPEPLIQAKLIAIKNLITGKLFQDDESRNILLLNSCKHLKYHLTHGDKLLVCTEILSEIISFLFKRKKQGEEMEKINNCIHHDVDTICIHILDILIQTVLVSIDEDARRDQKLIGGLVACLVGILQLLDEYHYQRLYEALMGSSSDRKTLKDFLMRVYSVFRQLVKQEVYPPDWLIIKMVVNNVMLKAMQEFAQPLAFKFLESRGGYFDKELWTNYFNLAVDYLTQQPLQLEQFSEVKRNKLIDKYGDMRVFMGFQILSLWSQLGDHKLHFIPSMVGPFLEVTLVPEIELRKATLHIFFDMMECEQRARGNFRQVESELIDKLDLLISENKGDDEYRQLFNTILLDRVQSEDPAWKDSGAAFISSVTRLLERLLDYRSVIQGDENRDKRMSCTFNLLNFYKNEFNRKEMYLRYIYKLHDLQYSAENFTEAGFTMKLYADQLTWSSSTMVIDPHYAGFTECQVKEKLYHMIITYYDKGKCWEKGIPLLKELGVLYETQLFNFKALSETLKLQAKFYDNILQQLRPEPEYFRVGFYGLSFPLFVRNKQFVYRGLEYERMGAFTQRLQTEFPSAQILTKNTPPDDTIINSDGQFIQICNVKPIPEQNPIISAPDIPEKIARFYHYNDVKRFQSDRPVHKGIVDKENEIKTLWIERTILEIESPLPGILRWFEVVHRCSDEIPPIQYACETMTAVERELRQLISAFKAEPKRNLNPFTMRLQGIIDANVQGGVSKYQQAFFTQEFHKLCPPEHATYVYTLKSLIADAMQVIEEGLVLHGQLAPSGVQPLHQRLLERFAQLRHSLGPLSKMKRQQSDSIVNSPLPPVPLENKRYDAHHRSNSSGNYSHLADGAHTLDADNFYTKPLDMDRVQLNRENLTLAMHVAPPIPQRDNRPRSQGFNNVNHLELVRTPSRGNMDYSSLPSLKNRESGESSSSNSDTAASAAAIPPPPPKAAHSRERSLTRPPSPRLLRHCLATPTAEAQAALQRSSWPEGGAEAAEEAPPLPPRSQHTSLPSEPPPPPSLPKRLPGGHRRPAPASLCDSAADSGALEEGSRLPPSESTSSPGLHAQPAQLGQPGQLGQVDRDLRDSGISISEHTNLNNLNTSCYDEFDLRAHQQEMNISATCGMGAAPPPIPPKCGSAAPIVTGGATAASAASGGADLIGKVTAGSNGSLARKSRTDSDLEVGNPENYSVPRLQLSATEGGGAGGGGGGGDVGESPC